MLRSPRRTAAWQARSEHPDDEATRGCMAVVSRMNIHEPPTARTRGHASPRAAIVAIGQLARARPC